MGSADTSSNADLAQSQISDMILGITVWKRGGVRAPHKPLLLLIALGRVLNNKPRLASFGEIEPTLADLLTEFGPARASCHPEYPFWRLQNDGVWELENAEFVESRKGNTDAKKSDLLRFDVKGGFKTAVFQTLDEDKQFSIDLARRLADENFPSSFVDDVLAATEITTNIGFHGQVKRDSKFRARVLSAYEYRCAVCGFDVLIGSSSIGLEAAHIKWKQADGPDRECNGIALCCLHHKLFDRGAFTLDESNLLLVSEKARGTTGFNEVLMNFHGRRVTDPVRKEYCPKLGYVQWHQREVFHSPSRVPRDDIYCEQGKPI